ncbi:MAG: hypothetical protein ABR555_11940 [Pyrinomonadaceae bacterium]
MKNASVANRGAGERISTATLPGASPEPLDSPKLKSQGIVKLQGVDVVLFSDEVAPLKLGRGRAPLDPFLTVEW